MKSEKEHNSRCLKSGVQFLQSGMIWGLVICYCWSPVFSEILSPGKNPASKRIMCGSAFIRLISALLTCACLLWSGSFHNQCSSTTDRPPNELHMPNITFNIISSIIWTHPLWFAIRLRHLDTPSKLFQWNCTLFCSLNADVQTVCHPSADIEIFLFSFFSISITSYTVSKLLMPVCAMNSKWMQILNL